MAGEISKNSFSEKIVNFDFDKYYTKNRRVLIHILVWIVYTLIIQVGYYLGYRFSFVTSVLMAFRITLCNIVIFYLLFYVVIPFTISKNRILLFIISIVLLVEIWLVVNHYYYVFLHRYGVNLDFGPLKEIIAQTTQNSIVDIVKPKNVLSYIFDIIGAISPVLFLKFGFDLSKTFAKSTKANRQIEKLNYDNLLIENKFLLSQLNPHFLFNTLNNLYALTVKKNDLAPKLILKLSEIMRYTLYEANVKKINISREVDFINNYFDMEKMRYPKEFLIEKNVIVKDKTIDIEPLLFFVFIENAFKYGLKSENPFLKLNLNVLKDEINFFIQNDTNNISDKNTYGGIGIENIRRRLELIYPKKHTLNIKKENKTFEIHLKIKTTSQIKPQTNDEKNKMLGSR